jgi:uncharacterized membrane protein HdeD (DUF308 family)
MEGAGYRFFGSLSVVVGVFVSFAGTCFLAFDVPLIGLVGLVVGIALIAGGIRMIREGRGRQRPGTGSGQ